MAAKNRNTGRKGRRRARDEAGSRARVPDTGSRPPASTSSRSSSPSILALFVRTFVVQAFKIPTGSMENNLLIGDHLLVNKFVFAPTASAFERLLLPVRPIERGDVVVFKYPGGSGARLRQAGDRPARREARGAPEAGVHQRHADRRTLRPFPRAALRAVGAWTRRPRPTSASSYGPVTVPADQLLLMGDNRDNSQDSRYWGFLPRSYVKGRALMVYWSFDVGPGGVPAAGDGRAPQGAGVGGGCTSSRARAGPGCCTRSTDGAGRNPRRAPRR